VKSVFVYLNDSAATVQSLISMGNYLTGIRANGRNPASGFSPMSDSSRLVELVLPVESRCGAVAVGSVCLLPPLSSGGALVTSP